MLTVAQGPQQVAVADLGAVHLVDEDEVRKVEPVEILQQRGDGDHALDHRLDHDDGEVDADQRLARLVHELDRARAVEHGEVVAGMAEAGDADLGAHLPLAGLGAGVADGVAVRHPALAGDGAADEQQALEQGRLARAVGADQG